MSVLSNGMNVNFSTVGFIINFTDNLLKQVLKSNETYSGTVLIKHYTH